MCKFLTLHCTYCRLFYHISLCAFGFFTPFLNPEKLRTVSRVKIVTNFVILNVPLSSLIIWWHLFCAPNEHHLGISVVKRTFEKGFSCGCNSCFDYEHISLPSFLDYFQLRPMFAERMDCFIHFYYCFKLLSYIYWEYWLFHTHTSYIFILKYWHLLWDYFVESPFLFLF
jgi:hypothetical protein